MYLHEKGWSETPWYSTFYFLSLSQRQQFNPGELETSYRLCFPVLDMELNPRNEKKKNPKQTKPKCQKQVKIKNWCINFCYVSTWNRIGFGWDEVSVLNHALACLNVRKKKLSLLTLLFFKDDINIAWINVLFPWITISQTLQRFSIYISRSFNSLSQNFRNDR